LGKFRTIVRIEIRAIGEYAMQESGAPAPCKHHFIHLRSIRGGPGDEVVADVFFCRRCLEYRVITLADLPAAQGKGL
jgi:hypothetical protein